VQAALIEPLPSFPCPTGLLEREGFYAWVPGLDEPEESSLYGLFGLRLSRKEELR